MKRSMAIVAPAKINLSLAVGPRGDDGYHAIGSIFQAISLSDSIELSLMDEPGIQLDCDCDCRVEDNTMYKAALLYTEALRRDGLSVPGISIRAAKRIPSGAGLGGGSSDAVAVLKALRELIPGTVDDLRLAAMAVAIGSDLPFFLGGSCAAVRGRGELVESIAPRLDYALVLAKPSFSIATKDAYGLLDELRPRALMREGDALELSLQEALGSFADEAPASWNFPNDFYTALVGRYPGLALIKGRLSELGADFCSLSGSGSCLFGVFMDEKQAGAAHSALSAEGIESYLSFPLARLPYSV
jgi:4-diphosphocytidyl-2-C-methyl-D-erythritol kinase